ncbi:hypothetical protein SDC9_140407 [bioreactor metagenome]|uniref:Uncharacterized protein n=1 Tax=bioreactor metagenome TaxID=1076179 RepID=A0A645DVB1_9ZZZZ
MLVFLSTTTAYFNTLAKEKRNRMTEKKIIAAINKVDGLGGMTVNERIYVTGLLKEFDKSLKSDKEKAKKILELLQVDGVSIDTFLRKTT